MVDVTVRVTFTEPWVLFVIVETLGLFDLASGARCSVSSKFPSERLRLRTAKGDSGIGMLYSRNGVGGL